MSRTKAIVFRALLLAVPFGAALAVGAPGDAQAQEIIIRPPPPAYIATVQPEYYEGRPVYWYGGNWYYRDGGRWTYYHGEPAYLRDRRAHWDEHRRYHYYR
jgi:hypothetical protein